MAKLVFVFVTDKVRSHSSGSLGEHFALNFTQKLLNLLSWNIGLYPRSWVPHSPTPPKKFNPLLKAGAIFKYFYTGGLMNVVQKLFVAKKKQQQQYFHIAKISFSPFKCFIQDPTCFYLFCKMLVILSRGAVTRHSYSDNKPHTKPSHPSTCISSSSLHPLISFSFCPSQTFNSIPLCRHSNVWHFHRLRECVWQPQHTSVPKSTDKARARHWRKQRPCDTQTDNN